jgi:catechol 2,3-dioxygenase-like lactoylglutathione lyase family enzyme
MAIKRMDNVSIVVEDLDAAVAFFAELGMKLEGRMPIEGEWAGRIVGIDNMRCEIAMMRMPDGHGGVELTKFHSPVAIGGEPPAVNELGIRRIMFAVDDVDDTIARLRPHGAELVGEVMRYEDVFRLCYIRGPEGILVGLAEELR